VVHRLTGHAPSFLFVPAKLKWFETNQPETYSKITTVFTISDWIIFRLSGERVSEICGASELGLIDIQHCQWAWKLKELLNLPDDIYPELVTAGSRVGEVTPQAAAETGLLKGTPVVAGAPDTHCGLIGMGVKKKGQAGIVLGWSAPIQMLTDEPIFDPKIWTGCYPLRERWILESSAGEAGNAYHWLKEIIFGEGDSSGENSYQLMDHLALRAPLGAEEVRAFIGPATMDMSRLRLKFGGFLFPLPLSVVNIKRDHLVRASLENICFAIKANCHQLEAISGLKLDEVRLGGSLAKSQCLTQILPSVLEMSISIPEITEVSALGAAICAAVGVGAYSTLEEGMEAMTPQLRVVEPDRLSTLEYAEYYQKWVITSRWLQKLSEEIK
jgi:autoinducer 2 (AI-2) kinase